MLGQSVNRARSWLSIQHGKNRRHMAMALSGSSSPRPHQVELGCWASNGGQRRIAEMNDRLRGVQGTRRVLDRKGRNEILASAKVTRPWCKISEPIRKAFSLL